MQTSFKSKYNTIQYNTITLFEEESASLKSKGGIHHIPIEFLSREKLMNGNKFEVNGGN